MKIAIQHTDFQSITPEQVAALTLENAPLKAALEQLNEQTKLVAQQAEQILHLKHQIDELLRALFGRKSERFIASNLPEEQLSLFEQPPVEAQTSEETEKISYTRKITKPTPKQPIRRPLPDHLPRIPEVIEPPFDTTGMKRLPDVITEILEVNPAKLWVRQIIRPQYAFISQQADGEIKENIIIAPMPSRPLEKIIAGISVLALICVEKFVDHLPFYRQIQRYTREGVLLKASTINDWFVGICNLLIPLYNALKKEVKKTNYLQADETHYNVQITQLKNDNQKKPPKGKTHRGQLWLYRNPQDNLAYFEYQSTRQQQHPLRALEGFHGHLQTDDYVGYAMFDRHPNFISIKCHAHVRRKFEEALMENRPVAELFLIRYQKLYAIERELQENRLAEQSQEDFYAQRQTVRQEKSLPILEEIKKLLDQYQHQVLPKRKSGIAVNYALKNWSHLLEYIKDGKLEIDNNGTENLIRPLAIGRKNYLFAGSNDAAQRAAMMYSFFAVCKQHQVNPLSWLIYVLEHISEYPVKNIADLLPHNWKKAQSNR